MDASNGKLSADVLGEVEIEEGVLVLRRIKVTYRLLISPAASRQTIERVHGFHARFCPIYRSLEGSIEMTTRLILEEEP